MIIFKWQKIIKVFIVNGHLPFAIKDIYNMQRQTMGHNL
jgi:hypothetical protein